MKKPYQNVVNQELQQVQVLKEEQPNKNHLYQISQNNIDQLHNYKKLYIKIKFYKINCYLKNIIKTFFIFNH